MIDKTPAAATGNAEGALEALEDAQRSQESTYDIELLRNEYRYKQAEVLAAENLEVRDVFQRVFAFSAARRTVSRAETTEQIRTAERERADQLSRIGELSLQDRHAAHIAYLQESSDLRTAMDAHRVAQQALIRPLAQSRDRLEIVEFPLSAQFPGIPKIDWIIEEDAYVQQLEADRSLLIELEGIDDDVEQTEQLLQHRIWLLNDTVAQLHSCL